ncbi:MAG: hypothetical protein MUO81_09585 [Thermoplasmata archaeon]|nr:hypothetical protein [Thermoplasmata archaeon]
MAIEKREWLGVLGFMGLVTLAIGIYAVNYGAYTPGLETWEYESVRMTGILVSVLGIVMVSLGLAGAIFSLKRDRSW